MVSSLKSFLKLDSLRALQAFQLFRFGSLLLVSVVFPRVLPGKELVGFYEKLLFIGGVSTSFWVSGIINSLLPYYSSNPENKQKSIMANSVILLSVLSLIVTAILYFSSHLFIGEHYDIFKMYLLFNLFSAPAFLIEYVFLLRKNAKALIIYGIAFFIFQSTALIIPAIYEHGITIAVNCLWVTALLRYLFLLFYVNKHYGFSPDYSVMKDFISKIRPYMLSLIVSGSMAYIDSFFIGAYYSTSDFAIYRYGARELFFVLLLANAFSNAMSAELSKHHSEGNIHEGLKIIKQRSIRMMHLLFPITILLLLVSKYAFPFFFTEKFTASVPIFNIYLLLIISRLIFPQTVLIALQKGKTIFKASVIEWFINVALDWIFISLFFSSGKGMQGIAFATILAYLLEKFILASYCKKDGITFSSYVPVKQWIIYSGITIGAYLVTLFV